jgi:hypothetical protein
MSLLGSRGPTRKILLGAWVPVAGFAMTVAELADKWLASNPDLVVV